MTTRGEPEPAKAEQLLLASGHFPWRFVPQRPCPRCLGLGVPGPHKAIRAHTRLGTPNGHVRFLQRVHRLSLATLVPHA